MISLISASLLLSALDASGFNYPPENFAPADQFPDPINLQNAVLVSRIGFIVEYETPIQIRFTSIIDETVWQCLAIYHPTALDFITKQRPAVRVDDATLANFGTSETRMMCGTYAAMLVANHCFPEGAESAVALIDSLALDASALTMNVDVDSCDIDDTQCLQDVAYANGYVPEVMASIVAKQMINYLDNDGWNADGSIGPDGDECTSNCMPYGDTTGYEPKLNRRLRWKPLRENNGKGFSYQYDHVTPHIGKTAVTKTISRQELESNRAPNPRYKYSDEMELVIERLADLATNETAKMLVEYFDDKISVSVSILFALDQLLQWSWEERQVFLTGFTAGEYDAVVQAWHEKVRWDRVRPTTLIKDDDDVWIETYAGPFQGVKLIQSRDFEAYKRVMPHSEYPSGSSCICRTAQRFTEILLEKRHGITEDIAITIPFPTGADPATGEYVGFAAGSSRIEPGVTPSQNLYLQMESLAQLSEVCGESRLWGGMHFTASVSAGADLCDEMGEAGYRLIETLLDGQEL